VSPRGFTGVQRCSRLSKTGDCGGHGYAVGIGCLIPSVATSFWVGMRSLVYRRLPLGIIPAYGGAVRLARYVGRGKAMEMVLLGERITAAEAYRVGLVKQGCPVARTHAPRIRLCQTSGRLATIGSADGQGVTQQRAGYRLTQGTAQTDIYRFHAAGPDRGQPRKPHQAWRGKAQAGVSGEVIPSCDFKLDRCVGVFRSFGFAQDSARTGFCPARLHDPVHPELSKGD